MNRLEIPDECEISIEHAIVHLNSAIECSGDIGQMIHDANMALKILLVYAKENQRTIP